jgi:methionyl-tRNA formyltransferase
MQICVAATPSVALPTLDYLKDSKHNLVSIITQPDKPAGRGQSSQETAVSVWSRENGIPCFKPTNLSETLDALENIELLITIGYGVILPLEVISKPIYGSINLHFSLLPRWRGAAPVQRAIEAGDSLSGVTVFALDEGMDTGPFFVQKRFALDSDITSDELLGELSELGVDAVAETLELIEKGVKPIPQSNEGATRAFKISKDEVEIDWHQPAEVISRKIRSLTSNPGSRTHFREKSIKIFAPTYTDVSLSPGELRVEGNSLLVGTSTFALRIEQVQPSGKPIMATSAWINGIRLNSGEKFE